MSNAVLARPGLATAWRLYRAPAVAIGLGLAGLGVLFHAEVAAAISVWIESTAYNHCFLVIPIALYLLWDRRQGLRSIPAGPVPVLALAGIPLALVWLLAERLGIMEGRQLAAISFAELLFAAVLGPRLWWAAAGPLLYLYFLVPVGEFLTPKLQDITTWFIGAGLDLLHIPAYIDGYTIEIPEGTFFVAEACAGLRFLVASVAFGCLYALLMYRSPWRRGVFIAVSVVIPIIANGFRALGVVVLGHLLGSAQAAAADHVLYGWLFFSLVILALAAAGLPFREDGGRSTEAEKSSSPTVAQGGWGDGWKRRRRVKLLPFHPTRSREARGRFFSSVLLVGAIAAAGPTTAAVLEWRAAAPSIAASLDAPPGCAITPAAVEPVPGARTLNIRLQCGDLRAALLLAVFSPRTTAGPVFAAQRRFGSLPGHEPMAAWVETPEGRRTWRVIRTNDPPAIAASLLWDGHAAVQGGIAVRARMAWASIVGGDAAPVLAVLRPEAGWSKLAGLQYARAEQAFLDLLHDPVLISAIARLGGSQ